MIFKETKDFPTLFGERLSSIICEDVTDYLSEVKEYITKINSKHPIKYTITNITKAAIPIVGYAAFAIYSHSFFHLCGSSCNSSSYVAFCIYGILAITSFR